MSEPTISVDFASQKLTAVLGRLDMAIGVLRSDKRYGTPEGRSGVLDDVREAYAAAQELAEACREARREFRAEAT